MVKGGKEGHMGKEVCYEALGWSMTVKEVIKRCHKGQWWARSRAFGKVIHEAMGKSVAMRTMIGG